MIYDMKRMSVFSIFIIFYPRNKIAKKKFKNMKRNPIKKITS